MYLYGPIKNLYALPRCRLYRVIGAFPGAGLMIILLSYGITKLSAGFMQPTNQTYTNSLLPIPHSLIYFLNTLLSRVKYPVIFQGVFSLKRKLLRSFRKIGGFFGLSPPENPEKFPVFSLINRVFISIREMVVRKDCATAPLNH